MSDIHLQDCIGQEPLGVHTPLKRGPRGTRGAWGAQDLTVYTENWQVLGGACVGSGDAGEELLVKVLLLVQGH